MSRSEILNHRGRIFGRNSAWLLKVKRESLVSRKGKVGQQASLILNAQRPFSAGKGQKTKKNKKKKKKKKRNRFIERKRKKDR